MKPMYGPLPVFFALLGLLCFNYRTIHCLICNGSYNRKNKMLGLFFMVRFFGGNHIFLCSSHPHLSILILSAISLQDLLTFVSPYIDTMIINSDTETSSLTSSTSL